MKLWLLELWRWLVALLGRLFMADPKDPSNNPGPTPGQTPPPPEGPGRTLPWDKPGVGAFSGIDYSKVENAKGLDGYFVWADLNGFAHLRKAGDKPGSFDVPDLAALRVPVLLTFGRGYSISDLPLELMSDPGTEKGNLAIADAYKKGAFEEGAVIPAAANGAFFKAWTAQPRLQQVLPHIELDVPRAALLAAQTSPSTNKDAPTSNAAVNTAASKDRADYAQQNLPQSSAPTAEQAAAAAPARAPLTGTVLAFIDDGCAFAHPHFLRGSVAAGNLETRVKRLWDQNLPVTTAGVQSAPAGFPGKGREFLGSDLLALINTHVYNGRVDEDAVYAAFAQGTADTVNRLNRRMAHGTHVMDLACGPHVLEDTMSTDAGGLPQNPRWRTAADAASNADIVFVQLPMPTVQDTSGGGAMTNDVMDAMTYIMSECDEHARVVLNLSWGTLAGPHTGTTTLERFIDQQVRHYKGRLQVVIPAGNGYQSRTHANFDLPKNGAKTLKWRVQPDDATESYLEIYTENPKKLRVTVTTPGGGVFAPVLSNSVHTYTPRGSVASPVMALTYLNLSMPNPPASLPLPVSECVLLALAPTTSLDGSRNTAPHGLWQIQVENLSDCPATVDAYIERDDVALGTKRGARQSYFEDAAYDQEASLDDKKRSFHSDPANAYVRREGVFNSMATGRRTVVVGGTRRSDGTAAAYSPRRPYSLRSKRAGTPEYRGRPLYYANTDESPVLRGVRAAGARAAGSVRLAGTSDAAPQVARTLYNAVAGRSNLPLPQVLLEHRVIPKKPKW